MKIDEMNVSLSYTQLATRLGFSLSYQGRGISTTFLI